MRILPPASTTSPVQPESSSPPASPVYLIPTLCSYLILLFICHHLPPPPPPTLTTTQSYHKIFFPKIPFNYHVQLPDNAAPHTYKQALKHTEWKSAMKAEFDALIRNQTWELKADGLVDKYKAWLVAKGFTYRSSLDYYCTFGAVDKPTTILKNIANCWLRIGRSTNLVLSMFFYADWAGNLTDRSFTTECTIARSSTEAEYRAVASVVDETTWVKFFLKELHVHIPTPPTIFCDNLHVT
ncbi:hypothetical protein KY285_036162 [Solanum tuberosum]|nr:hypothetical protein KY285_036162 [Solanum tuberosum]